MVHGSTGMWGKCVCMCVCACARVNSITYRNTLQDIACIGEVPAGCLLQNFSLYVKDPNKHAQIQEYPTLGKQTWCASHLSRR